MPGTRPTRLVVHGASGRVGSRVCALASADDRFELVAALGRSHNAVVEPTPSAAGLVVVDFSSDEGCRRAVTLAGKVQAAVLVGTTGLSGETLAALDAAATRIPVLVAANTSKGVAVMSHLVREAARLLGNAYEAGLTEVHHTGKRDAPSGTALRLSEAIADGCGVSIPAEKIVARREGNVVGMHDVTFSGPGERLEIRHDAGDRDLFAAGALTAAAWLADRPAGRYRIEEAFGIS